MNEILSGSQNSVKYGDKFSKMRVVAEAPTRIDIAGGTLDLWPIHQILDHKATVNIGVTLPARVEIEISQTSTFEIVSLDQKLNVSGDYDAIVAGGELPLFSLLLKSQWPKNLPSLKITSVAKSPAGAGLGGSSCLAITFAAALSRVRFRLEGKPELDERQLVQLASDIEARLIHAPTGIQDYWGAVRGQVNILTYPAGKVEVETLPLDSFSALNDWTLLCYSGKSRASAINNWEIFKRLFDGDRALLKTFNELGKAAEICARAVLGRDLQTTIESSKQEWDLRTRLWPNIETIETKNLALAAQGAGAVFSRVCGAGGGGVMAIFAPPHSHAKVKAALSAAGGTVLPASFANHGLKITDELR